MSTALSEFSAYLGVPPSEDWSRDNMRVRFLLVGFPIFAAHLPALVLRAPFNHIALDNSEPPAPPRQFPDDIQALRVSVCPVGAATPAITLTPHAIRYIAGVYSHFYIDIEGSFEHYLQKFSSKSRWTMRKKVKKYLENAGDNAFREYRDPGQMAEFYRQARGVAVNTYQDHLYNASIPRDPAFVLRLQEFAAHGAVYGYILFHQGVPSAYSYCLARGDTLTLWYTGFNPQFAHLHAGTVLTYMLLERLFNDLRFKIYDFGSGDFEYKAFFSTGSVRRGDVMYLRRTPRNFVLVYAHAGLFAVSDSLKRVLDIFGMRARMRQWVHARLY